MKNSFTLIEIILTIFISSLLIIYSLNFSKNLFEKNKKTKDIEISKINMLCTKIFLQKHKANLSELKYMNNSLYFKNTLLVNKIKEFKISITNSVKIDINYNNTIKQTWEF